VRGERRASSFAPFAISVEISDSSRSAATSLNAGIRDRDATVEAMMSVIAASVVVRPMVTTQPSLLPLIDDTMMPAMPQTNTTAHTQRMTRRLLGVFID
jgi:glutamine synthetase adenylyltransferase